MILKLILIPILGFLLGFIAGFIPGLHYNMLGSFLLKFVDPIILPFLFIIMLISSQFFEILKAVFLLIPNEGTSLAMHPLYKMIQKGYGLIAIKYYSIGLISSLFSSILILPLLINFIPKIYLILKPYLPYLLIIIVIIIISRDKWIKALSVFLISGIIGYFAFQILNQPLLILLTGFFGMPLLLTQNQNFPKQMPIDNIRIENKSLIKGIITSLFSSFLLLFIPTLGHSQSSFFSRAFLRKDEEFLISLGALTGFDVMFSLTFLLTNQKARIGLLEMMKQIIKLDLKLYLLLVFIALITAMFSYIMIKKLSFLMLKISNMNKLKINFGVLTFIFSLTFFFDGFIGLLFLILSSIIGMIAEKIKVRSTNCMGALTIPALMFYFLK